MIDYVASCISLVSDFFVKTTGRGYLYGVSVGQFPLFGSDLHLSLRVLTLTCLTSHYADLWSQCWNPTFCEDCWAKTDLRLDNDHFHKLTPTWQRHCALRTDYARRMALVETDVLV